MSLVTGKTAELHDEDFLRITQILCDGRSDEVFLVGNRLRRTRQLLGYISPKINEVCWIEDSCADGTTDPEKHPVESVLRLRQLRMTNKRHADINVSHVMSSTTPLNVVNNEGVLFCRHKFIRIYVNQAAKNKDGKFVEKSLRGLESNEVDDNWSDETVARPRRMSSVTLIDDGDLQVRDIFKHVPFNY